MIIIGEKINKKGVPPEYVDEKIYENKPKLTNITSVDMAKERNNKRTSIKKVKYVKFEVYEYKLYFNDTQDFTVTKYKARRIADNPFAFTVGNYQGKGEIEIFTLNDSARSQQYKYICTTEYIAVYFLKEVYHADALVIMGEALKYLRKMLSPRDTTYMYGKYTKAISTIYYLTRIKIAYVDIARYKINHLTGRYEKIIMDLLDYTLVVRLEKVDYRLIKKAREEGVLADFAIHDLKIFIKDGVTRNSGQLVEMNKEYIQPHPHVPYYYMVDNVFKTHQMEIFKKRKDKRVKNKFTIFKRKTYENPDPDQDFRDALNEERILFEKYMNESDEYIDILLKEIGRLQINLKRKAKKNEYIRKYEADKRAKQKLKLEKEKLAKEIAKENKKGYKDKDGNIIKYELVDMANLDEIPYDKKIIKEIKKEEKERKNADKY